ncbi:hypothetical protein PCE1_004314 [Barthelona sp. PCE]
MIDSDSDGMETTLMHTELHFNQFGPNNSDDDNTMMDMTLPMMAIPQQSKQNVATMSRRKSKKHKNVSIDEDDDTTMMDVTALNTHMITAPNMVHAMPGSRQTEKSEVFNDSSDLIDDSIMDETEMDITIVGSSPEPSPVKKTTPMEMTAIEPEQKPEPKVEASLGGFSLDDMLNNIKSQITTDLEHRDAQLESIGQFESFAEYITNQNLLSDVTKGQPRLITVTGEEIDDKHSASHIETALLLSMQCMKQGTTDALTDLKGSADPAVASTYTPKMHPLFKQSAPQRLQTEKVIQNKAAKYFREHMSELELEYATHIHKAVVEETDMISDRMKSIAQSKERIENLTVRVGAHIDAVQGENDKKRDEQRDLFAERNRLETVLAQKARNLDLLMQQLKKKAPTKKTNVWSKMEEELKAELSKIQEKRGLSFKEVTEDVMYINVRPLISLRLEILPETMQTKELGFSVGFNPFPENRNFHQEELDVIQALYEQYIGLIDAGDQISCTMSDVSEWLRRIEDYRIQLIKGMEFVLLIMRRTLFSLDLEIERAAGQDTTIFIVIDLFIGKIAYSVTENAFSICSGFEACYADVNQVLLESEDKMQLSLEEVLTETFQDNVYTMLKEVYRVIEMEYTDVFDPQDSCILYYFE